jgi:hypothetical protein
MDRLLTVLMEAIINNFIHLYKMYYTSVYFT